MLKLSWMVLTKGIAGSRRSARAVACALLLLGASAVAQDATPPDMRPLSDVAPYRRMLWVTRWDYSTPKDIERVMFQAAQARFSDVFFQVRGEGTVYFRSELEPWAWQLSGEGVAGTGKDPGWDPLAKAVAEAHHYGLRLHAYINVMPGWAQKTLAPVASGQMFTIHRSWFMRDALGQRMDPRRIAEPPTYAFLDPGLPQVREHLAALAGELAGRYAVDGIHLDYVRYPFEQGEYSYNTAVLDRFRQQVGGLPREHPGEWQDFRAQQVTATVRAISTAARAARPGIELSAAIIADPDKREKLAGQQARQWLAEGLLDAVAPMAYTGEDKQFEGYLEQFRQPPWAGHVWLGIWARAERNPDLIGQARRVVDAGYAGLAVFSYSELFTNREITDRVVQLYVLFTGGT